MSRFTADEPVRLSGLRVRGEVGGGARSRSSMGEWWRLQTRNLSTDEPVPEAHGIAEANTGSYQAIFDGEIVALDERGAPSFQRLQPRMHVRDESAVRKLRRTTPVIYEVFDLLWLDGKDLGRKPLRERQRRLDDVLTPMGAIRRSEQFVGTGTALFEAAKEQGLEGIIAKRLDAPYVRGRAASWVKIKAFRTMECVVGGWTEGEGGRSKALGALLLGIYRDGKLIPVGHVGSGFDERTLKELLAMLKERESPSMPFATEPRVNAPAHWCLPELVCEARYVELTREGTLRHPTYRGLRADVSPEECTGEERRESTKNALREAARATKTAADNGAAATRRRRASLDPAHRRS